MEILINIAGGIALLLWGVRMVRTGVTRAFGSAIRRGIAVATRRRLTAFATGMAVTGVLQSSTATALIVSSFGGRGMIALPAALAVMLGADVGSTLVVQVLSLDISWLSPLFLLVGVIGFLTTEDSRRRNLSRILIGLGMMLLAIRLIMLASHPLRDAETLSVLLHPLTSEPLLAILVAAVLTWLAHSSLTVVVLVMSLASLQVISMQLALVLVLGANVGGAITPLVMTLGQLPSARRVPLGNLLMRAAGAAACVWAVPYVIPYLAMISFDDAHRVANFHTIFNLALAAVFLPLVSLVAALVMRLLPEREIVDDDKQPRYLEQSALDSPAVALTCASRETLRMGDEVSEMLTRTMEVFRRDDAGMVKEVERSDDVVDGLHEAIKIYLTRLARNELDPAESRRTVEILSFTTNLEHVGDIIDKNLMELAAKKIKARLSFSKEGLGEIESMHAQVVSNLQLALNVFMSGDLQLARKLLEQKVRIREMEQRYSEAHYARIGAGRPESMESSSLHLDVLRDLKRINSHVTSVAYPILEDAGQIASSRLRTPDAEAGRKQRTAPASEADAQ
ncbi:MAG: Na/Pi cotransporter family protein [Thalassobaculum sp.]|uniref:Na/Pi cotransporter family protein n=1 Tax=Thalassobaculum sp. TaxID=2022740 RepID=UPI0032EDE94F